MARLSRLLTEKEVRTLKETAAVGGVPGLKLRIREGRTKTYVLVKTIDGQRRMWVVGAYNLMTLAEARKRAREMLNQINQGIDPNEEAKKAITSVVTLTVESLLREFLTAEEKRGRWSQRGRQTHAMKAEGWIRNHMSPTFKTKDVTKLTAQDIVKEFGDKWLTMRATPEKCIGEVKRAIDWAIAVGRIPAMLNPADMRGALRHLLPVPSKRPPKQHMPYLPPEVMPAFTEILSHRPGCASRALLFCILTASRIDNALKLQWSQVDFDRMVITIPRVEMKIKGLSFDRVTPLSPQAVAILRSMPRFPTTEGESDYVFRSFTSETGQPLSDTTLRNLIRRINHETKDIDFVDPVEIDSAGRNRLPVPHGLARASFETWARNPAQFGHEIFDKDFIDACLDHFSPKYGGAYMRSYPLEDMRIILNAWGEFLFSKCSLA